MGQVSPKEALPFQEILQTPYAVLCTTTTGGHLSWFESGGGRWFVKPVSTTRFYEISFGELISISGCRFLENDGP